MSDNSNDLIRQKALRAARAVTMGAALLAAGCSGDAEETPPSDGWGIGERGDASADVDNPVDAHVPADVADVAPDAVAEVGPTCSESFDQICPQACGPSNDADCCEQDQLCDWYEGNPGGGCGCAVPGPFAPPSMIV